MTTTRTSRTPTAKTAGPKTRASKQCREDSESEGGDAAVDPVDCPSASHAVVTREEKVTEEASPTSRDVPMAPTRLHLPGLEEVEQLALLLLQLSDDGDRHIVPAPLRRQIAAAAGRLHEHDRSARTSVRKYESQWGYTLFGRCLGADGPGNSAAQKTKFGWMRYAQAARITDESRLLYLLVKMLKNRPEAMIESSPAKTACLVKGQYKRIADRVRDDPVLSGLDIPLPNINAKSVASFLSKEEKRANFLATTVPRVPSHRRVSSERALPAAPTLPRSLPAPARAEVQYSDPPHQSGERRGEKRRLGFECRREPQPPPLLPRPQPQLLPQPQACSIPILMVVPSQPSAPSVCFQQMPSCPPFRFQSPPPPPKPPKRFLPNPSTKPCAACRVPRCGGLRKRYTPSKDKTEGSRQKIFTFCPKTGRSVTPGFEKVVYEDYDHFKRVVDEELRKRKSTGGS